jgi:N-acetylmuramic acid 6-phosphate etherase
MVLNMISTVVMVRLGKVYGNLMVNVQATNAKLKERVVRIVMDATSADERTAASAAERANGDARAAILMVTYQIGYEEAIRRLDEAGGHFGDAFASLAGK